jgi:hypothetical protein
MSSTTRTAATAVAQKTAAPALTVAPTAIVQRQCDCGDHAAGGECEECKKKRGVLARSASGPFAPRGSAPRGSAPRGSALGGSALRSAAPRDSLRSITETLQSPGRPLDRDVCGFMESRFQHDFSAVRVHTDAPAAASSRALQARAWALGQDVAFASGAYAPGTPAGRRLLAHELAHVVQQAHAPAPVPHTALDLSEPGDASEREAERAANRVVDEGARVDMREHPDADMIHRLSDDAWKGIGIGAGVAGLGALITWLALRKDATDIDDPPKCGPRQLEKINPAIATARAWTQTALERLRAFRAQPQAPANKHVSDSLTRRFRSADPPVVEKVERVIVQVQNKIDAPGRVLECHTEKSNAECGFAAAFTREGSSLITFCASFFSKDETDAVAGLIHELTHTLVGGQHIGDRGYRKERLFGGPTDATRLDAESALSNAESYAEFIADLVTGKAFGEAPPADTLDCPDDWKELVKESLARAQRANTNIAAEISGKADEATKVWQPRWAAQHVAGAAPSLDNAKQVYKDVDDALGGPIGIACKSNPADACAMGEVEWTDKPPVLGLCASWKTKAIGPRVEIVLTGLYGGLSHVDKAAWRTAFAHIATDTLTSERYGPPKRENVFGSAAWTPDLLRIQYQPTVPPHPHGAYEESGLHHDRLSKDLPIYAQPDCHIAQLPFTFKAVFAIDTALQPRPGPFRPPRLAMTYSYPQAGKVTERDNADSPRFAPEPGTGINTPLSQPVALTFDSNGTFAVDLQLTDPDSGIARRYQDQITVEPVHPCPDAAVPAGAPAGAPAGMPPAPVAPAPGGH